MSLHDVEEVTSLVGLDSGDHNYTSIYSSIWHVSSRSGVVLVAQTAIRFLTLLYLTSVLETELL